MGVNTTATIVSSREALLTQPVVCGVGNPGTSTNAGYHNPQVPIQIYADVGNANALYVWFKGAWHTFNGA
jgi:hypothetical protein